MNEETIMKNTALALLCYSVFLAACNNSSDTAGEQGASIETNSAVTSETVTSETVGSIMDSTKQSASDAMDAAMVTANKAADEAVAAGKELKDTVVEKSEAAVESVKAMSATAVEKTDAAIASVTGEDLSKGESIFKKHCVVCHGTGAAGAPKLGDKAAWRTRITQGNEILTRHAIEGFKGDKGYMPPKGGFMSISDDEIAASVQYMVSQSQ